MEPSPKHRDTKVYGLHGSLTTLFQMELVASSPHNTQVYMVVSKLPKLATSNYPWIVAVTAEQGKDIKMF